MVLLIPVHGPSKLQVAGSTLEYSLGDGVVGRRNSALADKGSGSSGQRQTRAKRGVSRTFGPISGAIKSTPTSWRRA